MNYTFNPEYLDIAAKFPISNLPAVLGSPVVVIPKALAQRNTRETYASVKQAKDRGQVPSRGTVYGKDGSTGVTAEDYRKTDIYPNSIVYNAVSTSTQLNDIVRDTARAFWKLDKLEPIGTWWAAGYGVGDKFDLHCDGAIRMADSSYKRIEGRLISAILYINDKDSQLEGWGYTGGELIFPGILDEAGKPLTIHPREGDLVIFPSSWIYSHAVLPVTSGYRVTLTNFFG